jgi:hypothetical protein
MSSGNLSRTVRTALVVSALWGGLASCGGAEREFARAVTITRLDETVGGLKASGRPGDYLLENDQLRAVILSGRVSRGPGLWGGSLVDVDLNRPEPEFRGGKGRDQFVELFPTANLNVNFAAEAPNVLVVKDGSDGEATVRVWGPTIPFLTLIYPLWGLVGMPEMWLTTDYTVRAGQPGIHITSSVTFQDNGGPSEPGEPADYPVGGLDVIRFGVEGGLIMGDFMLSGGSLDVFAPGIGFDEDGAVFEAVKQDVNIFADPFEFEFVAAVGEGVSYALLPLEGSGYVPLFTASQTAVVGGAKEGEGVPGRFRSDRVLTYERTFLVGHGDVGSLVDQIITLRGTPAGRVHGRVYEESTLSPLSQVDVFVYEPGAEFPYSQWRTDVRLDDNQPDGSFEGLLPVGSWELLVHRQGRPDGPRVPIEVTEGADLAVNLEALRPGFLTYEIRDERGRRVPSKLTVLRTGDTVNDPPNRQPALGDHFIGGNPETVVFTADGRGEVLLPPGTYVAIASRGIEYEIDESEPFTVDGMRRHHLQLQVNRSIDTSGWVGADLHVHSNPSHDSGVTPEMRLITMAAEGVEFFSTTDHDVIADFAPMAEELGLARWVQTTVGMETTTIEQGHFLGFPLQEDFLGDVGGAFDWTGMTPIQIVEALRDQGRAAGFEPFVFVAHPRDGILGYFDQYGFDPFTVDDDNPLAPTFTLSTLYQLRRAGGVPVNEQVTLDAITLDMDGIELFTSKRVDLHRTPLVHEVVGFGSGDGTDVHDWITRTMAEQEGLKDGTFGVNPEIEGTVDDWFSLLNLGYRFTAIGNSDTHGLFSTEAGCPRNFVMAETDDPDFLDDQSIADAVREHRVVASYGPFLRLWVDSADIGSEITSETGEVRVQIDVQAPSWMDVDRVELYVNAELVREYEVPADAPSAQRLYVEESLTLPGDAWVVAIATGERSLEPVFTPVDIPYIPLDDAVTGALSGVPLVATLLGEPAPFPKEYPVLPYALTNPIWVDVGGDGWTPPGYPSWWTPGELP